MENYRELIEEKLDNVILQHSYSRNREKRVGSEYVEFVDWLVEELDRAMEEGYEECKKDMAVSVGLATDTEFSEIVGKIVDKLLKTKEDGK